MTNKNKSAEALIVILCLGTLAMAALVIFGIPALARLLGVE